jgi:valyl-tRNA synthetase
MKKDSTQTAQEQLATHLPKAVFVNKQLQTPQKYDPKLEEPRLYTFWKEAQTYKFNPQTKKKIFSLDTPPPTMSGKMHIGHAFSFAQQDIMARFFRQAGNEVFYPFGTDDNGLPTEKLVQKQKNISSNKMERDEFINVCLNFVKTERPEFILDWIKIGMSCDFSQPYSTIDNDCRKVSQKTFLELAKKGLVYKKEAPVIWDTVFQSAIAQAELTDVEQKSFFNDIVFKSELGTDLIIATTRPELLGACVAVFYHPSDQRYAHLQNTLATTPLYNIQVPILADEKVDPQKGTGIVMCCTFGDQVDIEWYKKHNLPLKMIITKDGKMNEHAGKYAGQKIADARKNIIEDLKTANLLIKQKEISHIVNVGERSGIPVEILNSAQWYVKYLDKKEEFLDWANELEWKPEHMKHRLINWIKGLNWDWSIARQRKYGVPIPVWYDKQGKTYFADEKQLPVDPVKSRPLGVDPSIELMPETDVFDTWFTSASSPFLATQHLDKDVQEKIIPMDLRPQAHDIINFWLFYTLIKTKMLTGKLPFKTCAISGYVLDPKGEKMSKSKGNGIVPQDIIQKYSGDAIRYWAGGSKLGEDLPFQEKDLVTCAKLVNKLWNSAKFMAMYCESYDGITPQTLQTNDAWVLHEFAKMQEQAIASFHAYEYAKARQQIEQFFWTTVCDNYIESIKKIYYEPQKFKEGSLQSAQYALTTVIYGVTQLLAPFIPFTTDAVYQYFIVKDTTQTIHTQEFIRIAVQNDSIKYAKVMHELLATTRRYKAEKSLPLNTPIEPSLVIGCLPHVAQQLEEFVPIIIGTTNAQKVTFMSKDDLTDRPSFSISGELELDVVAPLGIKK